MRYLSACSISNRAENLASLQGRQRGVCTWALGAVGLQQVHAWHPSAPASADGCCLPPGCLPSCGPAATPHLNSVCTSSTSPRAIPSRPFVRDSTAAGVISCSGAGTEHGGSNSAGRQVGRRAGSNSARSALQAGAQPVSPSSPPEPRAAATSPPLSPPGTSSCPHPALCPPPAAARQRSVSRQHGASGLSACAGGAREQGRRGGPQLRDGWSLLGPCPAPRLPRLPVPAPPADPDCPRCRQLPLAATVRPRRLPGFAGRHSPAPVWLGSAPSPPACTAGCG